MVLFRCSLCVFLFVIARKVAKMTLTAGAMSNTEKKVKYVNSSDILPPVVFTDFKMLANRKVLYSRNNVRWNIFG